MNNINNSARFIQLSAVHDEMFGTTSVPGKRVSQTNMQYKRKRRKKGKKK